MLATTALAPNRSVHLLRVGNDVVLVGATDGGVTPLRVYEPSDRARSTRRPLDAHARSRRPRRATQRISFLEALRTRTARMILSTTQTSAPRRRCSCSSS